MSTETQTNASSAELPRGLVLGGRFAVDSLVRHEPLGPVYAATDQKTNKQVAVRVAAASIFGTTEQANVLRDECRTIARLTHPNLVVTYGVGAVSGSPYLATEWVEGKSVTDLVKERRAQSSKMSLQGAYNIVAHVCKGLTKLHEATSHGAVWPGTVWVTEAGRVRLADSGISLAALRVKGPDALGEEARGFLAPEILEGGIPDARSDVYGVGSLLFYLLCGRSPEQGFVPPSMTHPEATPALDDVVLRCLERDPKGRFASTDELRLVLQPIATGVQSALDGPSLEVDMDIGERVSRAPGFPSRSSLPTPPVSLVPEVDGIPADLVSLPPGPPPPPAPPAFKSKEAASVFGDRPVADRPPSERISVGPSSPFEMQRATPAAVAPAAPVTRSSRAPGGKADPSINIKTVLAAITEKDALRWMVVKDGLDHGPFTGRDLVQRIVKGEILETQVIANMETAERAQLKDFAIFAPFLEQQRLHKKEVAAMVALERSEKVEKHSKTAVYVTAFLLLVGVAGGGYWALTHLGKSNDSSGDDESAELDGKRNNIDIGTSGGGKRRGGKRGGKRGGAVGSSASGEQGNGGLGSYDDAMNQAVEVDPNKDATQLSRETVSGVMDKHLGSMFTCVQEELGRGGSLGQVRIDLAIMGDGSVRGASVSPGSGAFQQCIQRKVSNVRFPSFSAGRMGATYKFSVN